MIGSLLELGHTKTAWRYDRPPFSRRREIGLIMNDNYLKKGVQETPNMSGLLT
jgi:hypothetical protein